MLTHLRITNFALLDDVEVEFGPGFNVLTGETGAGKSLLVEAVALLRGGRASTDVVRAGADEARVEAIFEPPHGPAADALAARLDEAGIEPVDEGLVIRRVMSKQGRGRVYINNVLCTVAALSDVAGVLIELAGQHEHQTLGDPSQHLTILDAFADHQDDVEAMAVAYARVRKAEEALRAVMLDDKTRSEREGFLRFLKKELDDARLEEGEEERLKKERERLRAAEKLLSAARRGEEALYAREGAVVEELATLVGQLKELGAVDAQLESIGRQIDEARVTLEEAARDLSRYADGLSADPERLAEVEERSDLLMKLLRKHRAEAADVGGLIARRDALGRELDALDASEERQKTLAAELDAARADAGAVAARLHRARVAAAAALETKVAAALAELAMPGARLSTLVADVALAERGTDRVEFLLCANRGDEPRPLSRVASGGELSRIMLAMKRILSRADRVSTYVFDEVDAGIGGAVADVVGRQIRAVADDKQVLCITHLPQIAAHAAAQFRVEKEERDGRIHTVVRKLTAAERAGEIARMLGGKVTQKARAHAEELLLASKREPSRR